nr:MAG TPA: hypothetical protein [Bacteriophage sp.]
MLDAHTLLNLHLVIKLLFLPKELNLLIAELVTLSRY